MKKLLLVDADVVIDMHSLGLFEKLMKAYEIQVTQAVFEEARFFRKRGRKIPISLKGKVSVIQDIDIECLAKVHLEAKEARVTIDEGEATSIAYLLQGKEETKFCSCDRAAITLTSYIQLDEKAISVERALRDAGHHAKLFPRHFEANFRKYVKEGQALRIQYKKLI